MELWTGFFLLYSIMHPISDFIVHNRLGKRWHYLWCLNPFHWIWDTFFSFHTKWQTIYHNTHKVTIKTWNDDVFYHRFYTEFHVPVSITRDDKYWWRLGVDQTMHVLLNLVWAFMSVWILTEFFPTSPLLTP